MKAWAIKTPRGRLILETVCPTQREAWVTLSSYATTIDTLKAEGYRCVRVTVTEDEQ